MLWSMMESVEWGGFLVTAHDKEVVGGLAQMVSSLAAGFQPLFDLLGSGGPTYGMDRILAFEP